MTEINWNGSRKTGPESSGELDSRNLGDPGTKDERGRASCVQSPGSPVLQKGKKKKKEGREEKTRVSEGERQMRGRGCDPGTLTGVQTRAENTGQANSTQALPRELDPPQGK